MIRHILIALVFIAAFLNINSACASEPIGRIIEIEGTASKGSIPLAADMPVYIGDMLTTGAGSRLLVLFVDDTQITLGENSSLTLDQYIYDPGNTIPATGHFSVLRGAFLFVSGLLEQNPRHDVTVATSYGTIGLRGTTFWGGELDGEYGVLVQDGAVDVKNDGGTTTVTKGNGTFMKTRREKPRAPKAWGEPKISRAVGAIILKRRDIAAQRVIQEKQANVARRQKILQMIQKKSRPQNGSLENLSPGEKQKLKTYRENHPSLQRAMKGHVNQ